MLLFPGTSGFKKYSIFILFCMLGVRCQVSGASASVHHS